MPAAPAPAPAAAAPAAAPGAAPSKPSAPNCAAIVQPPPEKSADDWMGDAGSELETLADETPKPRKPADKKPAEPKPQEKPPEEETGLGELEEAPEQPEQPPAEKPAEPDVTKMGARDLRKAYESNQKRIKEELQPKIQKLEARVKELETTPPEDPKASERFKAIEKRNQELEDIIRFADYQQSSEFQDKYQKPYLEAWSRARADIDQLSVEDEAGNARAATDKDLATLAALPLGERIKAANRMFGDAAQEVLAHVRTIRDLSDKQMAALEDAKKNSRDLSEKRKTAMIEESRERGRIWESVNKELSERYPKWFAPIEGDADGNRLLSQGQALTALVFQSGSLTDEQKALLPKFAKDELATTGKLSRDSTIRVHAIIRNKAANHDRLARQLKNLQGELAEAKKALSEYESSTPKTGGAAAAGRDGSGVSPEEEAFNEIDELSRRER